MMTTTLTLPRRRLSGLRTFLPSTRILDALPLGVRTSSPAQRRRPSRLSKVSPSPIFKKGGGGEGKRKRKRKKEGGKKKKKRAGRFRNSPQCHVLCIECTCVRVCTEHRQDIVDGKAKFEDIAKTESDCSSAKRGGDLGHFAHHKMQSECPIFCSCSGLFGLCLR